VNKDRTDQRRHTMVIDTNVLINLLHVGRLDLLGRVPGLEFVAPEVVIGEVTRPKQARHLEEAMKRGDLRRETTTGDERILYAELLDTMDDGEAACLAMAQSRGWLVATDERRRVLRTVKERLGPGSVLNTAGLLVLAIRSGVLSVEEADRIKTTLEGRRFQMKFASFREVLADGSVEVSMPAREPLD
jgi:predicted nucleic acid-binding protein